jgi:nitrous oxidase accessory protein NosD
MAARSSRLALVVVAVLGLSAFTGAPAIGRGAPLSCGDTITSDTTLHVDLLNCQSNGIIIDADDVTLDLNGHLIDGDVTRDSTCDPTIEFCDLGIVVEGHSGVVVKNGSVRQFLGGVVVISAHASRVVDLRTSRNRFFGIGVADSGHIVIRRCAANRSSHPEGEGLGLFTTRHVRVLHSSFRHNAHVGIKPVGATDSLIKRNVIAGNRDEGLLMEGGSGFRIRHNRIVRNGTGITLGPGSHNAITRNRVSGGNDGIRVESGHHNLVAHNLVKRTREAGVRLGITHPLAGGSHNLVRRNRVRHNHGDGFVVGSEDRHSRLTGNRAKASGDDGFDIANRSAKLTRNRAVRNADLGIEAVPGVIDGGGNIAFGNGDPRQCTNIACSSSP